ncbi:heavy metal translocating P-type ATPase [Niabella pedocola]|uniref:P-type Zn(2+) transporter n=1 Tax=Niabella pedocola TaxID=1752077 RepID=A0ABS8PNQ7_9BACT|nr:heavy metal translocating P-type ATPase [Niabella pedocola]MCD2422500.1 heavy metal translocating P-type ATPase [Niabella pedocola]
MEKTRINLDLLLPEIPDERDRCVARIISHLQNKRGIDKIHVIPAGENQKAQLCFHYNPSEISLNEVEQIAEKAGAEMTERYGHLLINTTGVRHPRHARVIEGSLRKQQGIQFVAVSGTGFIQLEYQKDVTSTEAILQQIKKEGLRIRNVDDFHTHPQQTGKEAHAAHGDDTHEHQHGGLFGERTELFFALICGGFLGAGFGLSFVNGITSYIPLGCYIAAYFFGGFYTTKEAIEGIRKGAFEIDFLMLVAAVGAAVLGQWAEGALLLFLFSLGHSLEHYAMEKAKKSIAALASLAPKTALLKTGNDLREVAIDALKQGDIIVAKPNSKIAADGIVVKGSSSVNQAPITGESIPVDKIPVADPDMDPERAGKLEAQYKVFAGSINGGATLEIKVTRIAADSTLARLIKLVNEAQTQKSPTQNFTDRLEKYYVPSVLILVAILLLAFLVVDEPFSASFYRAMAVLVAASPCALAISTPSAVLSGVARAARGGVLIKGGKPLEELGALSAIAFDKTGTLTRGRPTLTGVYPLNGITEEQLLEIVIAVEQLSDHPLAAAIVKGGTERLKRTVPAAASVTAIQGRGIQACYNGAVILVGNKELFIEKNNPLPDDITATAESLEGKGHTTMLVQQNDRFIGIITLMDIARDDAKDTLAQLTQAGIRKMIMLTGDNQKVAEAIAKEIGITEAWGNLLPEQKVAAIEKLRTTENSIAMVGDGVNDAPAMAKSTVGIAMGAAGSDVALETADIALMADKLGNLPFAIGLSKKARRIIRQNLVLSLGMVVVLIPLTILGIADIGPAVIGHEGSTLVVVFNALRLLGYKK